VQQPLECQRLDLGFKPHKGYMRVTVTTEALNTPVAHETLLKPRQALVAANRAD
jgi:hypothetical protein